MSKMFNYTTCTPIPFKFNDTTHGVSNNVINKTSINSNSNSNKLGSGTSFVNPQTTLLQQPTTILLPKQLQTMHIHNVIKTTDHTSVIMLPQMNITERTLQVNSYPISSFQSMQHLNPFQHLQFITQ